MTATVRRNARRALVPGLVLIGLAVVASPVKSQTPALYGLNEDGKLSLNATIIDALSGGDWVSLLVDGSDRYALRDDGLVFKNGVKLYKLQCQDGNDDVNEGDWVGLALSDGALWALSERGYLAQDGGCVTQLPTDDFLFSTLFSGPDGIWSMRTDGTLFSGTTASPTFAFVGGPGLSPLDGEGEAPETTWLTGTVGPDELVYGLRRDGKLVRGDVTGGNPPFAGTIIATLPFGSGAEPVDLYADLVFTEDGSWNALRANGSVFREPNTLDPLIQLNDSGDLFKDLLPLPASKAAGTTDTSFMALRGDGNLFRETDVATVGELPKSGYGELALSLDPPDLTNTKNTPPVVTKYTVLGVTDTPLSFPILATDVDLAADQLVVTVDETTLPEGAVYDDVTRTVTWDAPVKGTAKIKVQVDDGVDAPVKKAFEVKVKDPDTNVDKNVAPRVGGIKDVQGLVGIPLVLPILASDQDGDPLTITVDETAEPFTLGAVFDEGTSTFTWEDPELIDIGTYKVKFSVSDGTKTVNSTVQVKIVSSLLTF